MTISGRKIGTPAPIIALVFIAWLASCDGAAAQHYEGCFVNGQQVSDAMCNGGASGGGGADSAAMGAAGSLGYALGANVGLAIRNMLQNDNNGAPTTRQLNERGIALWNQGRIQEAAESFRQALNTDPSDGITLSNYLIAESQAQYQAGNIDKARELAMRAIRNDNGSDEQRGVAKQQLAVYDQAITARNEAAAALAQRQFAANEQDLLGQIRPVHATPVVAKAAPKPKDDYVPNPVSRLDSDPRDYPKLSSYTKDQRLAHDMNHNGIEAAELYHDWARAMSNFAAAYDYDPVGPFSKVIRHNMEIAAKHLDAQRAQRLAAAGANANANANAKTSSPAATPQTGNAAAKPQPAAAQVKQVLPKTYAQCNAELQSQTNTCRRADGSWDREGCFNPAWTRFKSCVNGLNEASVH